MSQLQSWRRSVWFVPAVSGTLIVLALLIQHIGALPNPVLSGRWWLDPGHHAVGGGDFTAADAIMILASIVAGYRIVISAFRALLIKVVGIDLLVSVAAVGAIIIGNFWESAAVTFLFSIGHALEAATLNKTRSALAELVALVPDTAVVVRKGNQEEIPAGAVQKGEIVLVKNGAKIPVDGDVTEGFAAVNEASITGESLPVEKSPGDHVFAGTVNEGGFLQVRTTGAGADTTLARIVHRVEEAQDAKAPTQSFIERFSSWYTPAVILLAIVGGIATKNVTLALTLLVIGCPGALVISIPVAVVAGTGRAAREGILIKGGQYLERAARVNAVALDKTGTLTLGQPRLTDLVVLDQTLGEQELLAYAAGAESASEHPLARPIVEEATRRGIALTPSPGNVQSVPGKGILADVDGAQVGVGNLALLEEMGAVSGLESGVKTASHLASEGKTPMIVVVERRVIGVLGVADTMRPQAPAMIRELRGEGVREILMLTGDAPLVAGAIASQANIRKVQASCLPEDKLVAVEGLQARGLTVAMVGDGVNDAPALAIADVGVAMGAAGSAVAVETADIALMGDNLLKLPRAIGLARFTRRVMRQNIAVALLTVAILLVGVFLGGVTMSVGMLVHEGSVLLVIMNAMRLLGAPRGSQLRNQHPPHEPTCEDPAFQGSPRSRQPGLLPSQPSPSSGPPVVPQTFHGDPPWHPEA